MGNSIIENPAIVNENLIALLDQEPEATLNQKIEEKVSTTARQKIISFGQIIGQKCASFFTVQPILEPVGILNRIGANLVEEYKSQENEASLAETAQNIGRNTAQMAVDGLAQVVFFRTLEQVVPHLQYIPYQTLVGALGFAADVAREEEGKRGQTAIKNAATVAKSIGTAIVITSCSHLVLGAAAKWILVKAINELVQGGIEAALQHSSPPSALQLNTEQPVQV